MTTDTIQANYSLLKEGSGRFSVLRDGVRAGEVLGRRGNWAVHSVSGAYLDNAPSFQDAYVVIEKNHQVH